MDQYRFLLTRSDWSQTDVRFQDENSRCLLWRRMSSNRAVHPLMKPTGRQRHRNQSLHSPTHLTWLERLNWRARDCGCNSSCRCCCRLGKSATPASRCFEMIFNWGFFGVVSVARPHALTSVKVRLFFKDYVSRRCLFWWFSVVVTGSTTCLCAKDFLCFINRNVLNMADTVNKITVTFLNRLIPIYF